MTRQLPAVPAYAQPVSAPDPKAGESALAVIQRERQARKRANTIIVQLRDWYAGVRRSYGAAN